MLKANGCVGPLFRNAFAAFVSGFYSDVELVPFDVSAGLSGSPARQRPSRHGKLSDVIHLHWQPVGKWARTGSVNLIRQSLDRAVKHSVIMRIDDVLSLFW
jgi:hypothetical protein